MKKTCYAGTYTGKGSEGIYAFDFEDGILSDVRLLAKTKNPKYLAKDGEILAATGDFENGSGAALFNLKGEKLSSVAFEPGTSCYIAMDGNRVYTANYHEGTLGVLERNGDQLKLVENVLIRNGAGAHQVLTWNDRVLVPCLFLDRVMIYDRDTLKRLGSIHFNQGTGPRHGIFSHDGEYLYLASELSNELFVIKTGTWEILSSITVLPDGRNHERDTAAIRLSEDGRHIYVSTRTLDIISVVEVSEDQTLKLVQVTSCGGRHPRDFTLEGGYLLSANRHSNEVVCFRLTEDGLVGEETSRVSVPEAVSLVF